MVLPPKFKLITQDDFYHVTPLTTVLWSSVEKELAAGGALTCQSVMENQQKREQLMQSLKQAVDRVVYHYNIPENKLFDDFIATGDDETAIKAQEIVRGLQKSFSASEELKRAHPDAFYAYVDYHQGDSRDNNNAHPKAWYREQGSIGQPRVKLSWLKSVTTSIKISKPSSMARRSALLARTTATAIATSLSLGMETEPLTAATSRRLSH